MDIRFKDRLKALRKQNHYTQADVAKQLHISKSAYGYYEQGKTIPDAYTLNRLADIFNVTIDYIVGRTNASLAATNKNSIVVEDDLEREELRKIQEARNKMNNKDKRKMMNILQATFDEYFD